MFMTDLDQMIDDADDIEEIHEPEISVWDVLRSLAGHPQQILHRWNWKSAMLGAAMRASFYLGVYKASRESWVVTLTAMAVEFIFRFVFSGIWGAVIQSFRKASPAWLATLVITVTIPTIGHIVEYTVHFVQEQYFSSIFAASQTGARQKAFAVSVFFSVLSVLFNMFMMRSGVLLVGAGEETKSFFGDMKRVPFVVLDFVLFLPLTIIEYIGKRNLLYAFYTFAAFGIGVGAVLGILRGKWDWAWKPALGAWAILFVWTILVACFLKLFPGKSPENLKPTKKPAP